MTDKGMPRLSRMRRFWKELMSEGRQSTGNVLHAAALHTYMVQAVKFT